MKLTLLCGRSQHAAKNSECCLDMKLVFYLFQRDDFDSEDDKSPDEKIETILTNTIPTGTDKSPEILDTALKGFSEK